MLEELIAIFNGAIKYAPMLKDHPAWSSEKCLAFARQHHVVAEQRYRAGDARWNNGIPYCRNIWKEPQ
jgi:hypothetical protein